MDLSLANLQPNISFKTSRSGGKGGQNVNKVSTKVELNFDFEASFVFSEEQKALLREKFKNRMTSSGEIQILSEVERSQLLNKEKAIEKLLILLKNALSVQKKRKATKPGRSAKEKRLKEKQLQAMKKLNRKKDW